MKRRTLREVASILTLVALGGLVGAGFMGATEDCTAAKIDYCAEEVLSNMETCGHKGCTCDLLRWFELDCMQVGIGCGVEEIEGELEERGWKIRMEEACG